LLCAQGLHLSVPEIDFLINFYDNDGKGALNYDELVEALKGELTERRCVSPPAAAAVSDVGCLRTPPGPLLGAFLLSDISRALPLMPSRVLC